MFHKLQASSKYVGLTFSLLKSLLPTKLESQYDVFTARLFLLRVLSSSTYLVASYFESALETQCLRSRVEFET